MTLVEGNGSDAVMEVYLQILKGQARPDEGQILSTRPATV
jgi:hypothetical protein